ncbi:MAG: hypothetical protein AB1427_08880 [Thermodesulfobacteriota bacterium]
METKILIKNRLADAGIAVSEEILDGLVPMYQQWRQYINQARQLDISREEEPAHTLSLDI